MADEITPQQEIMGRVQETAVRITVISKFLLAMCEIYPEPLPLMERFALSIAEAFPHPEEHIEQLIDSYAEGFLTVLRERIAQLKSNSPL